VCRGAFDGNGRRGRCPPYDTFFWVKFFFPAAGGDISPNIWVMVEVGFGKRTVEELFGLPSYTVRRDRFDLEVGLFIVHVDDSVVLDY